MDEQRQQAYLELIKVLLECENGTENEVLSTHPDLVDEGLVIKLLAVARMMSEENDPEREPTIQWLNDFASQLATALELDLRGGSEVDYAQISFLMTVFQAISESNGDPHIIYPLCQENLYLLNEEITSILKAWVQAKFIEVDEKGKQSITAVISEFANLIAQFPLGSRTTNLEIAIACYLLALEVHTRDAYPELWARIQMNLAITYRTHLRSFWRSRSADKVSRVKSRSSR